MQKSCFLIFYIIFSLIHVKQSYAFSLSSIDVKNKFGEKFNAKITVYNDGKFGLKAYIGTKTDYDMMGVQRSGILNELNIKVTEGQVGGNFQFITVSSKKNIFYPSFELIVKAELDGGVILEKYIIAVDFRRNLSLSMTDEYDEKPEVNITPGVTSPPKSMKASADITVNPTGKKNLQIKIKENENNKTPVYIKTKKDFDKYGPVKLGETLYSIAKKLNIKGYATGQVVVALWKMNKRNFKNENMNKLLTGTYFNYSKIKVVLKKLSLDSSIKAINNQRISWRNENLSYLNNNIKKLKLLPAISEDMGYIKSFSDNIAKWRDAWESEEIDEVGKFYSEKFNSANKGKADWMKYKENFNRRHSQIRIEFENIEFLKLDEGTMYVSFRQMFYSKEMNSIGIKTLKFVKEGQKWYIENELWDGMLTSSSGSPYVLHTASVTNLEDAVFETNRLRKLGFKSYFAFFEIPGKGLWYRVFVNRFRYKISALKLAANMIKKNYLKYVTPMNLSYSLTLGSFANEDGARGRIKKINSEDINFSPFLYIANKTTSTGFDGLRYNVLAGAFYAKSQARFLEERLIEKKIDYKLMIP